MLKRIYVLIGTVLLLSVFFTGLIAFNVIDKFNRETNESKLHSAANLITMQLKSGQPYDEITSLLKTTFNSKGENIRYTIIDLTGKVLYDNEMDASTMENHLFRPEVNAAIQSKSTGQAIRRSETLKIEIYYYALYQSELGLVIRTSIPMVEYLGTLYAMGGQFVIVVGIALIALIVIGLFTTAIVTRPLIDLKKAAISMSSGQYNARAINGVYDNSEVGEVSQSFNKMAEKLESTVYELAGKNLEMNSILNSIGNPVIAVDNVLSVTFMNSYTREEFVDSSYSETGVYPLISIVRNIEIERLVISAISSRKPVNSEVVMNTRKGTKLFRIVALPMISPKSGGAIITFQDITQMQKLQQMRSDFVANVTHEIKTPLTSIRGFVDTLRQGAIKNPEVSERFLEIIDVEAERLHKLINDILSLSEIEDIKEDIDSSVFDLNSLIDEVMVLLDDAAVEKHVTMISGEGQETTELSVSGEGQEQETTKPFFVKASRNRIKQILINLVENAIKYNVDNGKVYITVERDENSEVLIKVRDTGNGIPKEHIPRVFERFYRVDKSRSKELGGTGLGLSIVKHIAMLYGGNASVESTVGQGSEFTVKLKI